MNGLDNKKKKKSKVVNDDRLDDEIKKVSRRLAYLRNRKKTGVPGGKYAAKRRSHNTKEYNADYAYYKYWVKDRNFSQNYIKMRDDMAAVTRQFVSYHNRILYVINKWGTDQEKALLKSVIGNNNEKIEM